MKKRLTAVKTEGQPGPFKGDGQFPVNSQAPSPWDTARLESAQAHSLPQPCYPLLQQSCLPAVCSQDKLTEFALCRTVFSYLTDIYGNITTVFFFKQEYIFNLCFTSRLTRSKQLADYLELSTFATNFIFKLTTMLSKIFQNYFENKTTTQANKKPNKDQKTTPSQKTKTRNTFCYYLSSSKTCKINGERNINKKQ